MSAETSEQEALADVIVSYRVYGTGERLITCLHSLALDGTWWEPLAEALGPDYRVLAPDLRGHGGTEAGESLTLSAMATDVIALWDQLGISTSPVVLLMRSTMAAPAWVRPRACPRPSPSAASRS